MNGNCLPMKLTVFLNGLNADQWEDNSHVCVVVSNAAGETLELGPAKLEVYLMAISLWAVKPTVKALHPGILPQLMSVAS